MEDVYKRQVFAVKRNNRLAGSPMADVGKVKARYVRLTFTGGQKNGFGGAVWNLKIFEGVEASVSYTHLDVYKRQEHILTQDEINEMARQDSIKEVQKNQINADLILEYQADITISPVSYTHLGRNS